MYKQEDLTVLIATKDRVKQIERAIKSAVNQTVKANIVVLDDASKIDIKSKLAHKFAGDKVKWIRSQKPSGVAGARNKLVSSSKGSIMVFLDDDAYFTDNKSLENIIFRLSKDSNIGAMAFKIFLEGKKRKLQVPFKKLTRLLKKNIINIESETSYFIGAGHVLIREFFEKSGGYHDELFYGLEEVDVSSEIIKQDKKIIYFPKVEILHHPEKSVVNKKNNLKDESYYSIRNRIWISYKHLPLFYFIVHITFWGTFYLIKLAALFQLRKYFIAVKDGFANLKNLKRKPFRKKELKYLRKNNGRLWY